MQECLKDKPMSERIATVARDRFAWPGGYALGLLLHDGECLCSACVAENIEQVQADTLDGGWGNWKAVAAYYVDPDDDGIEGESDAVTCVHCNCPISDATTRKR